MDPNAARIPYDACPLCSCQDATHAGTHDCSRHALYNSALPSTMRWVRCQTCRHVFVDGYFTPESLQVLFRSTSRSQVPGQDVAGSRIVSAPIIETLTALRGRMEGRWLDIGFGNGALLTTAAEYGYDVVGLDLRESSVRLMREVGYKVHCQDLNTFDSPTPFDVISMADVLEHMPFPRPALHRAHELLSDDGLLFLSMPNMDSFLWKVLDHNRQNPYWGELEHYHNFGRARLYELLRECSFSPCRYGISHRYIACMEVVARKVPSPPAPGFDVAEKSSL